MKIRLGVNIDHVATIRNARGETHPSPINVAKQLVKFGADSITIHLREDRRHINDKDLKVISSQKKIPLNLEIATNDAMLKIALKAKPNFVCLVPEKRNEITTEGGLNLKKKNKTIKRIINLLNKNNIRTSLFINPSIKDIKAAYEIKTNCIEIHTGRFANKIKANKNYKKEFNKIKKCSQYAKKLGLEVHAGHGLDYRSSKILSKVKEIEEFNIGHFIIGESISYGLKKVIQNFKKIIS